MAGNCLCRNCRQNAVELKTQWKEHLNYDCDLYVQKYEDGSGHPFAVMEDRWSSIDGYLVCHEAEFLSRMMTVRDETSEGGTRLEYFGVLNDVYQREAVTEAIRERVEG